MEAQVPGMQVAKARIGEVLVRAGVITPEQLEQALREQSKSRKPLGRVLVELGHVRGEGEILAALARYYGVEVVDPLTLGVNPDLVKLIPPEIARRYMVFPVAREGNTLKVAMLDPLDIMALEDIRVATGLTPKPCLAPYDTLVGLVERHYPPVNLEKVTRELEAQARWAEVGGEARESLLDPSHHAPVVRFVNSLIVQSIERRASDIHIEPQSDRVMVRHRVDGVLYPVLSLPRAMGPPIVTRIKVMAHLDVAEKRLPQEGSIRTRVGTKEYDLRVSVLPSIYGEGVVIRVLERTGGLLSLDQLGLPREDRARISRLISHPHGMLLVTGPTGVGKTTTLYAILRELNDGRRKIVTLEEPVEYEMPGAIQVSIRPEIGLTYSEALKFVLRHDPDVILVGEIRDRETAELSARAAMTGHLLLSTLHTNDAPTAIPRLLDLGIPRSILAFTLLGVVAQRLVRLNCPHCSKPYQPSPGRLERMGLKPEEIPNAKFMRGAGCAHCDHTGYYGRTGVFEILEVTEQVRSAILADSSLSRLRRAAREAGLVTIRERALQLALEGKTTLEEALRVGG